MKIYGIKTCDSCRKAIKALPEAEFIDVRATPLSAEKMEDFYQTFPEKLVNKSSKTWRDLDAQARLRPALELLKENPTLMKRPVIETSEGLHLGWGKDVQAAVLSA